MQMIQQLQRMRQKKKEQERQEEIDRASGANTLMNSKTMKFKI